MQKGNGSNKVLDENNHEIKVVEISEPNIQNMKLKNEIEVLYEEIEVKNQDIEKLKDSREELIRLNLVPFL